VAGYEGVLEEGIRQYLLEEIRCFPLKPYGDSG
jgi:hypothetical protein